MNIVFMGTPEFAVASLDILVKNNYNIVGVVTAPDKPAGRGQQVQQSSVKKYAEEKGLRVLQPEKLKDEQFIEQLRSLKAELQIVVAFRMLPEVVWNMPPLGTYNLHASLLPKYRGAAPINWAVINGETESGVTTFKLKHDIDTGNILFQEKTPVSETTTAGDLHDRLMHIGAGLVLKSVKAIESGDYTLHAQNDAQSIHAPKIFKDTCRINWNKPAKEVYNLVRGLSPYPAAYTELEDKGGRPLNIKIYSASYTQEAKTPAPGTVWSDGRTFIRIACGDGYLSVSELQAAGKKRMTTAEFLRGFSVPASWLTAS